MHLDFCLISIFLFLFLYKPFLCYFMNSIILFQTIFFLAYNTYINKLKNTTSYNKDDLDVFWLSFKNTISWNAKTIKIIIVFSARLVVS